MTVIGAFAMSSYAIAIADYLSIVVPVLAGYKNLTALVIMTLFFASTVGGSRFITILENLVTILLIVALALFVAFGVSKVDAGAFFSAADGGFGGFVAAIAVMGWACQGTTMAPISMAAVTDKPKHTIPLAILIITCLLAVIYAAMAYVAADVD